MFLWRPGLWKKGQLVVLQIEAICGSGGIPAFARTTIFLFHTLGVLSHVCEFFVTIYNFWKLQAILFVAQGDPSIYATILGALFYIMIFLKFAKFSYLLLWFVFLPERQLSVFTVFQVFTFIIKIFQFWQTLCHEVIRTGGWFENMFSWKKAILWKARQNIWTFQTANV